MHLLQLPVSKARNKYLFVLVDLLTRYAVAIPLKDKSAQQVTSALRTKVLNASLLGPPVKLLSDNGLEFVNATMTSLLNKHGVTQVHTTPYNPKANGATERLNRTLLALLRGVLSPGLEWDTAINAVLEIYNNSPHSALGMSPYEAITGRPPRHPQLVPDLRKILLDASSVNLTEGSAPTTNARLRSRLGTRQSFREAWSTAETEWKQRLQHHFGNLRDAQTANQTARILHRNTRQPQHQYEVGDLVMLQDVHHPPGVEGKLSLHYLGPWSIADIHRNMTASVADMQGNPLPRQVPLAQLKPWTQRQTPPAHV
jgi:hypothetical protein